MISDTATEPRHLVVGLLLAALLVSGLGCSSRSAPTRKASNPELPAQACLENLDLNRLERALRRCNAVVDLHRSDPGPLTDRSLLYTLLGRLDQACSDVNQAMQLVNKQGKAADPMISHELKVRQASCKQRRSSAGKG